MFHAFDFTFAGESASTYGLFLCDFANKQHGDIPFANQANILDVRLEKRITPLHYGVRYHDQPLSFTLIFGSNQFLDRYQVQEIAKWLTGYQQYQWLSIDQPDMEHMQFHCLIQKLTPICANWLPVVFEANIVCDCPNAYGFPFEQRICFDGSTPYRFYNDSTIRENIVMDLRIALDPGCRNIEVINQTTDTSLKLADLPCGGLVILFDSKTCRMRDERNEYNIYSFSNFGVLEFAPGDNNLVFNGVGEVTISGRCMYNVGA